MADDWQAGDLALCVRGGFVQGPYRGQWPEQGVIYTVEGTWYSPVWKCLFLVLVDGPPNCDIGPKWAAARFRKINPLTDEERDEFLADLNVPVRAVMPLSSAGDAA